METFPNAQPQTGSPGDSAAAEHARRSLDEARASTKEIATRGSDAIRSGAARTRETLSHTTDQVAQYVQAQPLKSMTMAVAAGAAIALLAGVLGRHHR
ncbi:hypothetical protein [Thiobacillus denitrificans]|jgi:ElaB/YqjD/DUF883 family membrane-anchored ribosome-binding protein|uniref:hypothetical protein n=1 Tax=Thiobacillus denitrificans TaxID=36861 RepID=UPI00036C0630|nr:hypothetical protein [Thiobacillus denitrificans]